MNKLDVRFCALAGALVLALALLPSAAHGQTRPQGTVGLGGQVGDPSGVTLKLYRSQGLGLERYLTVSAFDFLAAWDLDNFFYLNAHVLTERPIEDSPLNYYLGPGLVFGVRDERPGSDVVLGVSAQFGLNFFVDAFEVFLHLTPQLHLVPETEGRFGGGLGLRYYF